MHSPKRRLTTLLLAAAAALMLLPALAQGATTFGSRLKNEPTDQTCKPFGTCTIVSFIHPSDPNGDPYSGGAPVSGVITKFRVRAYAVDVPGQVTFRVADISLTNPADPGTALASAAGTGPTVTIQPDEMALETPITEVTGRLPVKQGQHLALDTTASIGAVYNSNGSKFSYVFAPPLVDGSGARGSNEATNELLVQASIEPDADGDGFGDETQDQCPSQATTQGACDTAAPGIAGLAVRGNKVSYSLSEAATAKLRLEKKLPGRRVGRKCVRQTKKNKSHKRCPRFKRIAQFDGPGAPGPNQVTLPGGKKLKPGTYRLTMTATDVAGNTATKVVKFTVKMKKKKRR